jgi:hypothetical protein
MSAPTSRVHLHERRSRRARLRAWLASSGRDDGTGYGASLTVLGTMGTAAVAILLTAFWMSFRRDRCVDGLPVLKNLPAKATDCSAFVAQPEFVVWVLLLAAQVAFAAIVLVPLIRVNVREIGGLCDDRGGRRGLGWVGLAAVGLASVAVLFAFSRRLLPPDVMEGRNKLPKVWPLYHYELRINLIVGLELAVGIVGVIAIWVVGLRLDRLYRNREDAPTEVDVKEYVRLRQTLTTALAAVAAIVGLGTLATGALRNAILALNSYATKDTTPFEFDEQYVLVYGLFFTGLLAISFLPSFFAMRSAGIRIREASLPLLPPTDKDFGARVDARKSLDEFLQIAVSATASFKTSVAILTPLATALVGLLLPKAG